MDKTELESLEPLSRNNRLLTIVIALIGTILTITFCILFNNPIIANLKSVQNVTAMKSLPITDYSTLLFETGCMGTAIYLSGMIALIAWGVIFIEYKYDKKYANYLSIIPVIGGIVCLIGLNVFPNCLLGCVLFAIGGSVLLTGLLSKIGFFEKIPSEENK